MKTDNLDNKQRLEEMYAAALNSGKCHSVNDFAALVALNRSFLSSMFGGSTPVSHKTLGKIATALEANGISFEQKDNTGTQIAGANFVAGGEQKILSNDNEKWFCLVAEKDKQIDRLLGIIENMQK